LNSSGATVFGPAAIGARLGSWSTSYPDVYALDFDSFVTAGTYTIDVSGPIAAASPGFRIDSAANLYSSALANSLYFYENERDGPNFISTPLRTAAGHLNDASAAVYTSPKFDSNDNIIGSLSPTGSTINAEGGWWDAGDYLKFVQTHSYVVALMLIGIRDFPNQMGGGTTSNYSNEAQFGLNWLQQMWNDSTQTLYSRSGSAQISRSSTTRAITISGGCRRPMTHSAATIRRFNISDIGRYSWRARRDRRSARILREGWRRISPNVFKFMTRPILRWPTSASSPPSIFSISRTQRRRAIS
jgi:hypothetical protein